MFCERAFLCGTERQRERCSADMRDRSCVSASASAAAAVAAAASDADGSAVVSLEHRGCGLTQEEEGGRMNVIQGA